MISTSGIVLPSERMPRVLATVDVDGDEFDLSRSDLWEPDGSIGEGLILGNRVGRLMEGSG